MMMGHARRPCFAAFPSPLLPGGGGGDGRNTRGSPRSSNYDFFHQRGRFTATESQKIELIFYTGGHLVHTITDTHMMENHLVDNLGVTEPLPHTTRHHFPPPSFMISICGVKPMMQSIYHVNNTENNIL